MRLDFSFKTFLNREKIFEELSATRMTQFTSVFKSLDLRKKSLGTHYKYQAYKFIFLQVRFQAKE